MRARIGKFLLYFLLLVLLASGLIYAALASSWVWKKALLPQLSKAARLDITALRVDFSPFSGVVVHGLKISKPRSWRLQIKEGRLRYRPAELLHKHLLITGAALDTPEFVFRQSREHREDSGSKEKKTEDSPFKITIEQGEATNGLVSFEGTEDRARNFRCERLSLIVRNFGNGKTGAVDARAGLFLQWDDGRKLQSETFTLAGGLTLAADWSFAGLQAKAVAAGADLLSEALDLKEASLSAAATLTHRNERFSWKDISLEAEQGGERLLALKSASGSYDGGKMEFDILLEQLQAPVLHAYSREFAGITKLKGEGMGNVTGDTSAATWQLSGTAAATEAEGRFKNYLLRRPAAARSAFQVSRTADKRLNLQPVSLQVSSEHGEIGTLEAAGSVAPPGVEGSTELFITSSYINVSDFTDLVGVTGKETEESEVVQEPDEAAQSAQISLDVAVHTSLKDVRWKEMRLTDVNGRIVLHDAVLSFVDYTALVNGAPQKLNAEVRLAAADRTFQFQSEAEELELEPIQRSLDNREEALVRGKLTRITFAGRGKGFAQEELKAGFSGELNAVLGSIDIPAQLHDVPPFNVLFIPFQVLGGIGSLLPLSVLPAELLQASASVQDYLGEAERLRITGGSVKMTIADGTIKVTENIIKSNFLPTVDFPGQINPDQSIEINSGIWVLGQRLPLPIRGSFSFPYPDIPRFVIELVKSIGLSPVRAVQTTIQQLKQLDPRKLFSSGQAEAELQKLAPAQPAFVTGGRQ